MKFTQSQVFLLISHKTRLPVTDADRAVRFHNDRRGVALNYEIVSRMVGRIRECAPRMSRETVKEDWKEEIEADFMSRKAER
jgi:hypothetical protein